MTEKKEQKWICGFWRRIWAFLGDSVLLGIFGLVLGLFLGDIFVEIGAWGRLVGFTIALVYFGAMDSQLANGQTLGKKLLRIRVVDSGDKPISLIRAVGRYCVIGIPFFLDGAQLPIAEVSTIWLYLLSLVVFGGLLSIGYLYIFNRVTRQSLHDLAFGTYVVNAGADKQVIGSVWRPHLAVVGVLFLAAAIAPLVLSNIVNQEQFQDLLNTQRSLMKNPAVRYVSVSSGESTVISSRTGSTKTTYASARALLRKNQISNNQLAHELAETLVNSYPQAREKNVILIKLSYGYDIGIASKWYNYTHRFHPGGFDRNRAGASGNE